MLEIDVTSPDQLAAAGQRLAARWDRLDGILHAIGFAPPDCLGSGMFTAGWDDVSVAAQHLHLFVEGARRRLLAAPRGGRGGWRRVRRGVGLRRLRRVAGLRLDGCRQGGPRIAVPVSREGARAALESGSTSWQPVRCGRWRPNPSPDSVPSRTPGRTGRHWGGTSTIRSRWRRRALRSSATSFR